MAAVLPLRIDNRWFTVLCCAVFLLLILLAWSNRFIQDDAFISFRYADNLTQGNGLIWNEVEKVEGYSNFLWTVFTSVPLRAGADPITFALVVGLACFACSMILTYKLGALLFYSRPAGLVASIVLGTNYTFSAYATGGLETSLQTCLFVACIYVLARELRNSTWNSSTLALLSLLMGAVVLVHYDSALLPIVIVPFAIHHIVIETEPRRNKVFKAMWLALPFTALVGSWLIWKKLYYGDIIPNSFYVKMATATSMRRGFRYLYLFVTQYWLFPFIILGIIELKKLRLRENSAILMVLILIVLWSAYLIWIGGDFMEFRFLVPVLPLVCIAVTWLVFKCVHRREVQITFVVILLFGSLHHILTFKHRYNRYGIDTIEELHGHILDHNQNWPGVGTVLGRGFEYNPNVSVATTACGSVGFYSRLSTIDMHGLNDRWIARHGIVFGTRPGHQRMAPLGHLIDRKVNIVISHPLLIPMYQQYEYNPEGAKELLDIHGDASIPNNSRILEIPIDREWKLVVLYLTKNPAVDEAIERNNWNTYPLRGDS